MSHLKSSHNNAAPLGSESERDEAVTVFLVEGWAASRATNPHPSDAPAQIRAFSALVVGRDGRIRDAGEAKALRQRFPEARICSFAGCLALPGFVDAHLHFPQMGVIGAMGDSLLGWLNRYTLPAEAAFANPEVAREAAGRFVTELLANGTTAAAVLSSPHRSATETLFEEARARGLRAILGKVSMDRHAPEELLSSPERDTEDNEALIEEWHGREGRLFCALTPRFAPACSLAMLESLGRLKARHPDVFVQTHHAESKDEVRWVRELFPDCPDYLSVYDRAGLLGERTLLAHCVHPTAGELDRIAATKSRAVHCPSANLFLGSGLFAMEAFARRGIAVALGTDVGAGTSFSMWRMIREAYCIMRLRAEAGRSEIGRMDDEPGAGSVASLSPNNSSAPMISISPSAPAPRALSPAELFWLATAGGARALGLPNVTADFAPGSLADFQVLDWRRSRLLRQRFERTADPDERLAALISLADDRLVSHVYIGGRLQYENLRTSCE